MKNFKLEANEMLQRNELKSVLGGGILPVQVTLTQYLLVMTAEVEIVELIMYAQNI